MPNDCYTKLFHKILDSTIWLEDNETRLVWITMLASCDMNGMVDIPLPALANKARVPLEACQRAVERFLSPDPHSRTKDNEGRRIAVLESGGWQILNHRKYRDLLSLEHRRAYKAAKARQYRDEARAMTKGEGIRQTIRNRVASEDFTDRNGG